MTQALQDSPQSVGGVLLLVAVVIAVAVTFGGRR